MWASRGAQSAGRHPLLDVGDPGECLAPHVDRQGQHLGTAGTALTAAAPPRHPGEALAQQDPGDQQRDEQRQHDPPPPVVVERREEVVDIGHRLNTPPCGDAAAVAAASGRPRRHRSPGSARPRERGSRRAAPRCARRCASRRPRPACDRARRMVGIGLPSSTSRISRPVPSPSIRSRSATVIQSSSCFSRRRAAPRRCRVPARRRRRRR